ncbi:LysR family transcriptional regulator [Pseudonocardia sichuanensis]
MELRQLRYFCAVAEQEHLTRAADLLGIRPTSLSQQIIALERTLGTALFRRTPAGMTPTAAGRALLPQARHVLDAAEEAMRVARAAGRTPLRIGVTPGAPPAAGPAMRAHADVDLLDVPVARQLELLHAGGLDAGLVVLPADTAGLCAVTVSDVPLGVLVADTHALAGAAALTWADLDDQDLLWFDRALAPGYHDAILASCRAAGWRPGTLRAGPPRRGLFVAELRHGGAVVALRPRWDRRDGDGLAWVPLAADGPRLRHALVWDPSHDRAGPLAALAADLAAEAVPHDDAEPPRGRR